MREYVYWIGVLAIVIGCQGSTAPTPASAPTAALAPTPIATPSTGLVVRPPAIVFGNFGLFREESFEATKLLATWASGQGHQVIPPNRVNTLLSRTRVGRDLNGQLCGLPLSDFWALRRYKSEIGGTGTLDAELSCSREPERCRLIVEASFDSDSVTTKVYEAPYVLDEGWLSAIASAIDKLKPRDARGGFGYGTGSGTGAKVVVATPEKLSTWVRRARSSTSLDEQLTFPKGHSDLRSCFIDDGNVSLLVELDGKGRVQRCQSQDGDDQQSLCACEAFKRSALGSPMIRGTRLRLDTNFHAADVVIPSKLRVRASIVIPDEDDDEIISMSHKSIENWEPPAENRVAQCFPTRKVPATLSLEIELRFDSRGQATHVQFADEGAMLPGESDCVSEAFFRSVAPCPAVESSTAKAFVEMELLRIGSKIP